MESIGQLFVLSGPSGVGKSSLRNGVRKRFPELAYSISYTTRPQRQGESEGRDYHFVSLETFLAMKEAGDFVECAQVHGNYYGTSRAQLEKHLNDRRDLLLEIDVQGARQVKEHFPRACFIFVLPPNLETLEQRLVELILPVIGVVKVLVVLLWSLIIEKDGCANALVKRQNHISSRKAQGSQNSLGSVSFVKQLFINGFLDLSCP